MLRRKKMVAASQVLLFVTPQRIDATALQRKLGLTSPERVRLSAQSLRRTKHFRYHCIGLVASPRRATINLSSGATMVRDGNGVGEMSILKAACIMHKGWHRGDAGAEIIGSVVKLFCICCTTRALTSLGLFQGSL